MDLSKAIQKNLHYYKQVQAKNDAHRTKAVSHHLRKEHLEKQKINNYQNEYDRIRGVISQSTTANHTPLLERKKKLEKLGAKIIDHIV
jgi:hypothetical protein